MTQNPQNQSSVVMENAKAYRTIKAQLLSMIGSKWAVGTKIPPIKALAAQIGAGQTNTHKAVKELVSEGLLASRAGQGTFVLDAMANLEHSPSQSPTSSREPARPVAGATVGIVSPTQNQESFMQAVIESAQEVFASAGCHVTRISYARERRHEVRLDNPGIAAHLILNWDETTPIPVQPGHPLVCLSTTASVRMLGAAGYDIVLADSVQGGYLAGERFKAIGCKSVCFIGVTNDQKQYDHTSSLRLEGLVAGYGKPIPPEHQLNAGNYATTSGAAIVRTYLDLKNRPPAIFCASDDIAVGFVHGALAHGIQPGKDYLIIGFDGQQRTRNLPTGALTTAAIPVDLMGRSAANFLITRMAYPDLPVRRLHLGCSLIEGTTARIPE
jgi:DNA-binding LacI/PurR family transcriptional regulator